ncbi:MAG: MFS transporter, partial [Desulfobacterales bacterium]|nr:MFS transporter [Desulfobacterales bacterium]
MTLLSTRRFAPFFWTQFAGAFNDNVFKNVLMLLLAFRAAGAGNTSVLMNLAAGLFILPFFLFSSLAGQ